MIRILQGDCREVLKALPDASVHCAVTSPPYFGLRDYGTALWDGGDAACDHIQQPYLAKTPKDAPKGGYIAQVEKGYRDVCGKCGATRIDRQIGLESSPSEYLATMVAVMREVRRVLRPDGTCWVNMGDSYASTPSGSFDKGGRGGGALEGGGFRSNKAFSTTGHGAKPKDLLMMPARLALALQADGWWLRSDIIWAKPNPMPESVTDRPTSSHEHIFLLTKRATYFYDSEAVREASVGTNPGDLDGGPQRLSDGSNANTGRNFRKTKVPGGWDTGDGAHGTIHRDGRTSAEYQEVVVRSGRNLRNVWSIATAPYPDAHFATFPPELAERCIKAGTSERGCCAVCGAPWGRQTTAKFIPQSDVSLIKGIRCAEDQKPMDASSSWSGFPRGTTERETTSWSPTCSCNAGEPVPCTVLDPFAGAFTTAMVADRLQRDAIGIELNSEYCEMARRRIVKDAGMFANVAD